MARALKTDPINELEENLQCTVCLQVLTDPRTLPCCHSFCKDCLEGVVETLRGKAPRGRPVREFPCPYCRATFALDLGKHVADMPRNHFICNMVKVAAVLDRGIGVPCSHNCSQSYSVARCVTCEKFLCRECLTAHNNYRASNGHSVLTMEQLSKPENRKKIKDKMCCNEHSGKKLKVYCKTCDQLICKDCMDFKHVKQGHSCVLVKDVANNYKELLASNGKAMEDALTEGNVFLKRLTLTTQQLDRDAKNAKNKIAQRKEFVAKKVIEMLNQKAKSLCKKVDEIHEGTRANLDRQAKETKLYVENVKTSVQLSKKLIDQGTEEEIISSQKMMLDNANNLLTKRQEYFKAPIPVAKLSYTSSTSKEPINEEILRGLAKSFGEVNTVPDYWDSTLIHGKFHKVNLSTNSEEYQKVETAFHTTAPNQIVRIERIQNKEIYEMYEVKRQAMMKKYGGNFAGKELRLFHGTSVANIEKINARGLNRNYTGMLAMVLGRGVCFSRDAIYSCHPTYSPTDPQGFRYMYYAKVLVGEYTLGNSSMIVPPSKDSVTNPNETFDSVVERMKNPNIYLLFNDDEYYTEYLITFR